ncbi:hypothetical protein ACKLNR_008735 [Fusarium oxysporum f. sp. zingiberi]|nr:hypothetical protein H9L39_01623 [Fusarium oxysporum f. sp. albedinis]KAK2696281.1 hypothetical protein QWA68_005020 [Fusarium oxysporum]
MDRQSRIWHVLRTVVETTLPGGLLLKFRNTQSHQQPQYHLFPLEDRQGEVAHAAPARRGLPMPVFVQASFVLSFGWWSEIGH